MVFETYTYFQIILAGFVMVWSYRNFSKSQFKISDFEYLGWSSFWGLCLLLFLQWVLQGYPDFEELIANPFATGLILSIFGFLFGFIFGGLVTFFRKKNKKKLLD